MDPLNHIDLLSEDFDLILQRSRDCWQALDGGTILITGGSGFFGTWLAHSFFAAMQYASYKFDIHIACREPGRFLDAFPYFKRQSGFSFHRHNVLHPLPFQTKFDHIIHAATSASAKLNAENPLEMIDTIVTGTRNVLDFAVAKGIKSISFMSSGAVYGSIPYRLNVPETALTAPDTQNPRNAYAEAKRLAELLCSIYASRHGMALPILRCFAFLGPFMVFDAHFAMGNFIQDAIQKKAPLIKGDHRTVRSYMYGADLVQCILRTLCRRDGSNSADVTNVGSDVPVSIAELAELIRTSYKIHDDVVFAKNRKLNDNIDWYVPSIEKLKGRFGFEESQPLESSIQKTGKWLAAVRRL